MTTAELFNALQAAPSDIERACILEATTEEEREALNAQIAYEKMCSRAPLDELLARLDGCVDDNARADVLAAADHGALQALHTELKFTGMNEAKAAALYLEFIAAGA